MREAIPRISGNAGPRRRYRVYVIELKPEAWERPKLRRRNPDRRPDKPVVYVGYTSSTPEERFANHLRGHWAARLVRDFGVRLRPRLYRHWPEVQTEAEARDLEAKRAHSLRRRGYAVWEGRVGPLDL